MWNVCRLFTDNMSAHKAERFSAQMLYTPLGSLFAHKCTIIIYLRGVFMLIQLYLSSQLALTGLQVGSFENVHERQIIPWG